MPLIDGLLGASIPKLTWFGAIMSLFGIGLLECGGSPPCVSNNFFFSLLTVTSSFLAIVIIALSILQNGKTSLAQFLAFLISVQKLLYATIITLSLSLVSSFYLPVNFKHIKVLLNPQI